MSNLKTKGAQAKADLANAGIGVDGLVDFISEMQPHELRDFLCDLTGVNRRSEKGDILKLLGEKF
ncbi:MAG: hypothetical protein LBL07_00995 [Tannerella sp.]|jgi:hypothetical protein|nr:hypothetical protein [Tannerella sp.]